MYACIFVYMKYMYIVKYMYIDHLCIYSSRLTHRLLQAGVRGSLRRRKYRQTLAGFTLQASLRSVGVSLYSDINTCKRACMHNAHVFMYLHVYVCTCLLTYAHRAGNTQGVCVCDKRGCACVSETDNDFGLQAANTVGSRHGLWSGALVLDSAIYRI